MNVQRVIEDIDIEDEAFIVLAVSTAVLEFLEFEDDRDHAPWVKVFVDVEGFRRLGDPTFRQHFRMSKNQFEELVKAIGDHISGSNRLKRVRTPLWLCVMMSLWIIFNRDTFRSTALHFHTSPGVLFFHYAYIVEAIREMAPLYIKWPNQQERNATKHHYFNKTGFPNVVGSIDGMHTFITAPLEESPAYFNRHHNHSILTQAVADHNLLVRDLYVGEPGSLHDSRVFRRSPLSRNLLEKQDLLSPDEHLLGDGAYILTDKVLVPYADNGALNATQLNFNRTLSACRSDVERTFGHVKNKCQRLKYFPSRRVQYAVDHIVSSFVIHNFIVLSGEEYELETGELQQGRCHEPPPVNIPQAARINGGFPNARIEPDHPLLADARIAGEEKRDNLAAQMLAL